MVVRKTIPRVGTEAKPPGRERLSTESSLSAFEEGFETTNKKQSLGVAAVENSFWQLLDRLNISYHMIYSFYSWVFTCIHFLMLPRQSINHCMA